MESSCAGGEKGEEGAIGAGKSFISGIDEVVRVRTGESGSVALYYRESSYSWMCAEGTLTLGALAFILYGRLMLR